MFEVILKWAPLALSIVNVGFAVIIWIVGKTLVSREMHETLERRVAHLEEVAEAAPGWDLLNELRTQLAALNAQIEAMRERQNGMRALLERTESALALIQEHLLEAAR